MKLISRKQWIVMESQKYIKSYHKWGVDFASREFKQTYMQNHLRNKFNCPELKVEYYINPNNFKTEFKVVL